MLFPSLRDPCSNKDYISHCLLYLSYLQCFHRKMCGGSMPPDRPLNVSAGGPKTQRATNFEGQLDGDVCKEAMSLLNHTTDKSIIFQNMKETFQHCQKLVDQDIILLFDAETASRLLQKWDMFFRTNVTKEVKRLTSTAELSQLLLSAESPEGSDLGYEQEMASLLLLIHLLPPPPGGQNSQKISACIAAERLVVFHKLMTIYVHAVVWRNTSAITSVSIRTSLLLSEKQD
ncbi:uncharacterized protein LOC113649462 [Tachysurus ichikawai]